jgi:hypothetical protein
MIKPFCKYKLRTVFNGMLITLLLTGKLEAQQVFLIDSLKYEGGTKEERELYKKDLHRYIKLAQTTQPDSAHWSDWSVSLWAMELMLDTSYSTRASLKVPLDNYFRLNKSFKRTLLEVVYTIAPHQYAQRMADIGMNESDLKHVLMCRQYLLRNQPGFKRELYFLDERIRNNTWANGNLKEAWLFAQKIQAMPPADPNVLRSLFAADFMKGETVIYSIQRRNREYEGLAIVRDPNGYFVMNENREICAVPQLARSINELPWYLTNGNTPQGIYSIQGIDISSSEAIGQTPNIQLVMPFESSVAIFFHDSTRREEWNESLIRSLLPAALKKYDPLLSSFYAGKAGRTEIIAHGTTVDPSFYERKTFYPNTPTMGCLSCTEFYSEENGRCIQSNQLVLVNTFLSTGRNKGYLVVIDIDDERSPVKPSDLKLLLSPKS